MSKNEKLETKRHSLAHIMAASIQEMFPEAKFGVGPVIEDGFYYDVHLSRPLTPEDLQAIEKRMRDKVKQNLRFERSEMPLDDAVGHVRQDVAGFQSRTASRSQNPRNHGCRGSRRCEPGGRQRQRSQCLQDRKFYGPLPRPARRMQTSEIEPESFRLTRVSGAYWRGNQQREQMQRVYGVAFDTKKELEDYFVRLEEAKKRDHRKLGRELGSVHVSSVGAGCRVLAAEGNDALQHAGELHARRPVSGGLR